jgi:preprotein translocase subunit SecA
MFNAARPWMMARRADSLEAERRILEPKRSDEIVSRILNVFKLASLRPQWKHHIEMQLILLEARKLKNISNEVLVDLVLSQRPHFLKNGFRGRPLRIVVAGIREMSGRRLGMRHHPVQIMGGLALLRGTIVEMATGEGKTLTTLIPAITAALAGVPVHVITVNSYLAQRDCENLLPVIETFGLQSAFITEDTPHEQRPNIYKSDIVFSTNKDIAFDYLRDRIALAKHLTALSNITDRVLSSHWMESGRTLRQGLGFAIVDEVDSILIDEAQTPLIITAESKDDTAQDVSHAFLKLADTLEEGMHFDLNRKARSVRLLKAADDIVDSIYPASPELIPVSARREKLSQALSALHLYNRDEHYIVTEEEDGDSVAIVDEYTGRVMADRQWQRGLHQMIEAKENVELSADRNTLAQITYQTFFARYLWFAGMTGTAQEVARELTLSYQRPVLRLPTHKRKKRKEKRVRLYGSSEARWQAVVAEALHMSGKGRPVLIGTRSVDASEHVANLLKAEGATPVVLNARQDASEADIVAKAGEAGRITVATNMAGRGTDIPVPKDVEAKGGLHVILTEFHTSARIDRQFIGRTGRQGQKGSSIAIVSLEDPLFVDMVPGWTQTVRWLSFSRKGRLSDDWADLLRFLAQNKCERQGRKRRQQTILRARKLMKALGFRPDNI